MAASEKSKTENPMSVVKQHITDRSFSRIYLFCGSEQYLARQCMNNLVEAIVPDKANSMSYTRFVSEKCDLNAICSDMVTLPFFDEYRLTLVEDSGYFSSSNDKLKDAFETVGEQNIVIFYETNIDKRTSTYKAISKIGTVLEFETPDEETLTRWIIGRFAEDNLQIQHGVPEELLQIAGENMLNLSNELEKLRCYAMEKGTITMEDISLLCSGKIEDKIFEMCDAIGRHDEKAAISRYNDLVALKASPMYIITMIARHFRILAQLSFIQEGRDKALPARDKAALVGIKPFALKKYLPQLQGETTSGLLKKNELCLKADYAVKSGQLSDSNSVEKLIISLL
jgi:DNA polymerase-3 subunit delta